MDFHYILGTLALILELLSVIIIVWGTSLAFKDFVKIEIKSRDRIKNVRRISVIKNCLGVYILLALEILIGADIIESILNPSFKDLLVLASIVIIRTIISYFLNKEIKSDDE